MAGRLIISDSVLLVQLCGYEIDSRGFVLDQKTGEQALATDGKPIKADEVAAINRKGIWRKDLISIIKLSDSISTPGK